VNGSSPEPLKSLPFMLRYLSTNGRDFSGTNLNLMAVTETVGTIEGFNILRLT
jgi:hypothetical protein